MLNREVKRGGDENADSHVGADRPDVGRHGPMPRLRHHLGKESVRGVNKVRSFPK